MSIDQNKDGYIDINELNEMKKKGSYEKTDLNAPVDAIEQGLKLYDDNADGRLDAQEFGNMVKETKKDEMERIMNSGSGGKVGKGKRKKTSAGDTEEKKSRTQSKTASRRAAGAAEL